MELRENDGDDDPVHEELSTAYPDPLIRTLHRLIRIFVKTLAMLMVLVIFLGVLDVVYHLYDFLKTPPILHLSVSEIFDVFAAFMVVLIAIEIFINIRLYLGSNVLPVRLVIATALMAIARKVIVLDLTKLEASYVFAIGIVTLALGITYWLIDEHRVRISLPTEKQPQP